VGSLTNRVALVTGAGIGIGQGTAVALAGHGASVMVHSAAGAEETVASIKEAGGSAALIHGDLQQVDECRRVVAGTIAEFGGIDILINNAGVTRVAAFTEMSEATYDELFDLNMKGYFFCAQSAVHWMRDKGRGRIINISSVHGHSGKAGHTAYAATKGAISAFTRALAIELASDGIRVNCVAPGAIEVPRYFNEPHYPELDPAVFSPIGRVGKPADIGETIAFLVSDETDFITGQTLYVDGGLTSKLGL
jgi:NAD(P)-dependent dehydrogenase (short-subunit alcohol dehydrogenase family)